MNDNMIHQSLWIVYFNGVSNKTHIIQNIIFILCDLKNRNIYRKQTEYGRNTISHSFLIHMTEKKPMEGSIWDRSHEWEWKSKKGNDMGNCYISGRDATKGNGKV